MHALSNFEMTYLIVQCQFKASFYYIDKLFSFVFVGNRFVSLPLGEGVDRDTWGQNVPEDVQAQVDSVREDLLDGWSPFVGPISDASGTIRVESGVTMEWADIMLGWDWPIEGILVRE